MEQHIEDQLTGARLLRSASWPADATVRDAALDFVRTLLETYDRGEVDSDYGYGTQTYRSVSITLAGGGPGAEIIFAFRQDGDLDHAYVQYIDLSGTFIVEIPTWYAEKLATALEAQ